MRLLGFDYAGLTREFGSRFGKGEYHAGALFRSVYRKGEADPTGLPEFAANPSLAAAVREAFPLELPEVIGRSGDGDTYKFLLKLADGMESESVVIPMRQY